MPTTRRERAKPRAAAWPSADAFSLIEVVIAIGVVAILIGLALPSLGAARERARVNRSVTNLGSIAQVLSIYAGAEDDRFPVGEPGRIYQVTLSGQGISASFGSIFDFGRAWPVVTRSHLPWNECFPMLFSPGAPVPSSGMDASQSFSYPLSHSVMARPGLWRLGAVPDPSLIGGRRFSEVSYPASKVVSWDDAMRYVVRPVESQKYPSRIGTPRPMLFADGHVDQLSIDGAAAPIANVMNPVETEREAPLHNTPFGVAGRDF